jgi:hypothetical protein
MRLLGGLVIGMPVSCDLASATDPDAVVSIHMVEKPLQSDRTPGMAYDSKMQSDRHHSGRDFPFAV